MIRGLLLLLAIAPVGATALAAPATAQERTSSRFGFVQASEAPAVPAQPSFRPLRIAKWGSAILTAAAAGFGLAAHTRADDRYQELERACAADPDACALRQPNGAYADPQLERLYQDVLRLDKRARLMLIGSQVGVAASVVFFILDLSDGDSTPRNIPYTPGLFRVAPGSRGGLELGVAVPVSP